MNRGVKFLSLTDNPPHTHIGIALATPQAAPSRLLHSFTEHALKVAKR